MKKICPEYQTENIRLKNARIRTASAFLNLMIDDKNSAKFNVGLTIITIKDSLRITPVLSMKSSQDLITEFWSLYGKD